MDQNKYIEVRIFEPVAEIPATDTAREYSIKTLSTIHECDSSKVPHSYVQNNVHRSASHSANLKSSIRSFPSSKQRADSLRSADRPLDIDLLLRYYACNSDMKKSINKVLEKSDSRVCKDTDQGPLVELNAAYKICDSLKESSPKHSLSTFRFHDILTKLRSLIRRCSNETLEQILSSDPSMRMCKHCGVISYSNPLNISVEPRGSPPKTSYFLSTQLFSDIASSGDDDPRTYRQIKRMNPNKEQVVRRGKYCNMQSNADHSICKQHAGNGKTYGSREVSLTVKRENNFHINAPQRIETMVAERENDNAMQRTDRTDLQSHVKNSQTTRSPFKEVKATIKSQQQREIIFNVEDKNEAISDTNFRSNLLHDRYFSPVDYKERFIDNVAINKPGECGALSKGRLSINDCNEKVVRDILYENPKSYVERSIPQNRASLNDRQDMEGKQNQSTDVVNDTTSSTDVMTYLARGRLDSLDGRKKEFVSQLGEGTCVHFRCPTNRHGFVLHDSRDYNTCLNSECLMHDKLLPSEKTRGSTEKNSKILSNDTHSDRSEHNKSVKPARNSKQFNSFTCLMEEDSLENCIRTSNALVQPNESNTTIASSSSAENMIREWVKTSHSCKENTWKPSVVGLNMEPQTFWSNEKSVYRMKASADEQGDLQAQNMKKTKHRSSSKDQTKFCQASKLTLSSIVNGSFKLWNSKDSMNNTTKAAKAKKSETHGSEKRFRKHLFEFFRSNKSLKSKKSKEVSGSTKPSASSSISSSGDRVRNITRKIIYDESSLRNIIDSNANYANKMEDVLLLYRKVLESTEEMDWQSFQRFVEDLHPSKKTIWRDICETINDKLKNIMDKDDGSTEICIEITSTPFQGSKHERRTCSDEIVFEMDITLADIERCLGRQLLFTEKEQLDTPERASEVIKVRNDDVCDIEVVSNQAE